MYKSLNDHPGYFGTSGAAEFLDMSVAGLRKWRQRKQGPRYYKVGRRILYSKSDLVNFVTDHASIEQEAQS